MAQVSQTPTRKRIWLRRGLYAGLFTLGSIGIALWVITRSWFIVGKVEPELAARLGGDVTISSAAYEGGGRFLLRDLTLRAPGHDGDAGEVLRVARARLRVDEARLLRGSIKLEEVELDGVVLRLAESATQSGEFTFMSLDPKWDDDAEDDPPTALPRLHIPDATVEYGTYEGDHYTAQGRRHLRGLMQPGSKEARIYHLALDEIDESGKTVAGGIAVTGVWDVESNAHTATIDGLVLDKLAHNMVPQGVRWWWDNLNLEGRLTNAVVRWVDGEPLAIVFDIENVGITLPLDKTHQWARYHAGEVVAHEARPRLRVHKGKIRFENDAIIIDEPLVGELRSEQMMDDSPVGVGVPWEVSVNIQDLRPVVWDDREVWMRETLASVPFSMGFAVRDFRVAPDEHGDLPPVDLPMPIAQALQRFRLEQFDLTTQVEVTRGATGEVMIAGQVQITDASGAYEQFPYPLHDIKATISFVNDFVTIDSLVGYAPSGALVTIYGTIDSLGREAQVDLELTSERVQVDEHLRRALASRNLTFFDTLMNEAAESALRASGKIEDAEAVGETFAMGGEVALNLTIERAKGERQPTHVTGLIGIHSLGLVFEHFPYPFTAVGGQLRLEPDGVSVIEDEHGRGVAIVAAGGGTGFVEGEVRAVRVGEDLQVLPNLRVEVEHDRVNPLMMAAIPRGREPDHLREHGVHWAGEELSKPVALLASARLGGFLNYVGRIYAADDTDVKYDFVVDLQGEARPGAELAARLGEAGLLWPPDLVLTDVEARLRVTDGEITLVRFHGDQEYGEVGAIGSIDWHGEETETALDIELIDFELGRYLIDLFPAAEGEAIERLWDRYEPSGHFNGKLEIRTRGEDVQPPRLTIDPTGARLRIDGESVSLTRQAGGLTLADGRVMFDDLVLSFLRGEEELTSDGDIHLSGSYGLSNDAIEPRGLTLHADWIGGRFDSPIVDEALRLVGADQHRVGLARFNARGQFNAEVDFVSASPGRPQSYDLTLQPRTLRIDLDGTTLDAEMHEDSRIQFGDDRIEIEYLSGVLGGEVFSLTGHVDIQPQLRIVLDELGFDGRLMNEQVLAILPGEVRKVLKEIDFSDGARTTVEDARLTLVQKEGSDDWAASFSGVLRALGAAFDVGSKINGFDGALVITFDDLDSLADENPAAGTRRAPQFEVDVYGERLLLANRRITNLIATDITLGADGKSISVPDVRAELYDGLLWAEATIGLVPGQPYDARLEVVGASIPGLMNGESQEQEQRGRRRGEVNAGLRLEGTTGSPETRSGRGMIRAVGGTIDNVPLLLQMMQVLQLSLPLGGALDNAHVEFMIDGERAVFERILLESTFGTNMVNMQLIGEGEMDLRSLELRTQFRSRGAAFFIRDLIGGIGDQLYTIEISGTLTDPKARIVPLPGLAPPSAAKNRREQTETTAVVDDAGDETR